jgi:hypothetical protein
MRSECGGGEIPAWLAQWTTILLSTLLTFATVPSLAPAWRALGNHPIAIVVAVVIALAVVAGGVIATRAVARAPRTAGGA